MTFLKRNTMDILFGLNVILVIFFTIKQFQRLLVSNEGVSTSLYLCAFVYILILFLLIVKAKRELTGRIIKQLYTLYVMGLIVYSSFLLIVIFKWTSWDNNDWITTGFVVGGIGILLLVTKIKNIPFNNPYVKGFTGLIVKAYIN